MVDNKDLLQELLERMSFSYPNTGKPMKGLKTKADLLRNIVFFHTFLRSELQNNENLEYGKNEIELLIRENIRRTRRSEISEKISLRYPGKDSAEAREEYDPKSQQDGKKFRSPFDFRPELTIGEKRIQRLTFGQIIMAIDEKIDKRTDSDERKLESLFWGMLLLRAGRLLLHSNEPVTKKYARRAYVNNYPEKRLERIEFRHYELDFSKFDGVEEYLKNYILELPTDEKDAEGNTIKVGVSGLMALYYLEVIMANEDLKYYIKDKAGYKKDYDFKRYDGNSRKVKHKYSVSEAGRTTTSDSVMLTVAYRHGEIKLGELIYGLVQGRGVFKFESSMIERIYEYNGNKYISLHGSENEIKELIERKKQKYGNKRCKKMKVQYYDKKSKFCIRKYSNISACEGKEKEDDIFRNDGWDIYYIEDIEMYPKASYDSFIKKLEESL